MSPPATFLKGLPVPSLEPKATVEPRRSKAGRLMLWEIDGCMQCSIIGTCLGDDDLLHVLRRNDLTVGKNAQSYDIHSYCVKAASTDCALARSLNKLLERRYAAAVKLIGRAQSLDEIKSVWTRLRDGGQVAGAYWAVMSHQHVDASFKAHVFGEVHMLSHLNGHGAHQLAMKLSEAERRCGELEARLRRAASSHQATMIERDEARAALLARPQPRTLQSVATPTEAGDSGAIMQLRIKLAQRERALLTARGRARSAEAELAQLKARRPPSTQAAPATASLPAAQPHCCNHDHSSATMLKGRRILYIGGRAAVVPHLRMVAAARAAEFAHHDGGIEDNAQRIEEMIDHCDVVVCPIDCISHGACRLAKSLCHRMNKTFLPIPTASRSGFERALEHLSVAMPVKGAV